MCPYLARLPGLRTALGRHSVTCEIGPLGSKARHLSQMMDGCGRAKGAPHRVTSIIKLPDTDHAPRFLRPALPVILRPPARPWVTTTGACLFRLAITPPLWMGDSKTPRELRSRAGDGAGYRPLERRFSSEGAAETVQASAAAVDGFTAHSITEYWQELTGLGPRKELACPGHEGLGMRQPAGGWVPRPLIY